MNNNKGLCEQRIEMRENELKWFLGAFTTSDVGGGREENGKCDGGNKRRRKKAE